MSELAHSADSAHAAVSVPSPCEGPQESTRGEGDGNPPPREGSRVYPNGENPKLRYIKPYWWPYMTYVKKRWIGRQLLEVVSTEFRDRSVDYYRHALESGVTKVNGHIASPDLILRDGDRVDNTVHRHEPPITNDPILLLHIDREKEFIVISKPGSIPVHATGRYYRHTVLELLELDHGIKAYSVNRLDRLTSGLMILALSGSAAGRLATEFREGTVRKEYVARVWGRFPEGEITVDQPLLSVDRQMGLVIVTPEGKEAKTIFKRLSYDAKRGQSVVHCRPQTGRTHQIRVHLQYLGYPIANDPLYGLTSVWGSSLGRGGIELAPPGESSSTYQAEQLSLRQIIPNPGPRGSAPPPPAPIVPPRPIPDDSARLAGQELPPDEDTLAIKAGKLDLRDREYENIDITSPIRLSRQAKDIIAKLRKMRDEQEDWVKWKEVVFTAKAAQDRIEAVMERNQQNQQNQQNQSEASTPDVSIHPTPVPSHPPTPAPEEPTQAPASSTVSSTANPSSTDPTDIPTPTSTSTSTPTSSSVLPPGPVLSHRVKTGPRGKRPSKRVLPNPLPDDTPSPLRRPDYLPPGFCDQCFVPLPDDPDPEGLFIYLHALRYTTENLGRWETPLPRWAGSEWDGDWRGWSDEKAPEPEAPTELESESQAEVEETRGKGVDVDVGQAEQADA